ncbi:cytochrome P450 [Gordonia sinesedis]
MSQPNRRPQRYPFNGPVGIGLSPEYTLAQAGHGLARVQLPHGEPAWLATRYDDVRRVLGDRRFSRAEAANHDEPRNSAYRSGDGILSMDPPDHTRLRAVAAPAFSVRRVEHLRPRVREIVRQLIDELLTQEEPVDFVESFAQPLPIRVICEVLGVPGADRQQFQVWTDAQISTSALSQGQFDTSMAELRQYISMQVTDRRASPRDDLISVIATAHVQDPQQWTEQELVDLCVGILVAGYESTATQLANFVYVLLTQPERWHQLIGDPDIVPSAVEELMRYVAIGIGADFPRYATEDVELGGELVRAGAPVLASTSAANWDSSRFANPERVMFDRSGIGHLGFGYGAHHCLGAPLARLELQEALRGLTSQLSSLSVAALPQWRTNTLLRGPRRMLVGW